MDEQKTTGTLYIVATPIGNSRDMSERGREILSSADIIAAEDTRRSVVLLNKLGIRGNSLSANHKFNEYGKAKWFIEQLASGKDIAVITDAGTPCISDPGNELIRAAIDAGIRVVGVPGCCAAVTALSISGFDLSTFFFFGFFPREAADRRRALAMMRRGDTRTYCFYESPKRIMDAVEFFISEHAGVRLCLCNDMTKLHEMTFRGTPQEVMANPNSLTGQYLSGKKKIEVPKTRRKPNGWITVKGASEHNLKNIDVRFPLGVFTCVTGVSGSGKSSLVNEILYKTLAKKLNRARTIPGRYKSIEGVEQLDKIIAIDQSPIGRTPRSNPATYTGVFDMIRDLFAGTPDAKARGYSKGRFSFNVRGGRCEACQGDGIVKIEMNFLPDVYVPCEVCNGKRFNRETLEVKYKGKNIYDILEMTVEEALDFFKNVPSITRKIQTLYDVGLGYVKLGQPSTELSGGEAQRIKLATELSRRPTGKTIYVLDEPTTGLHFADVHKLVVMLDRLAENGNTVIVIEHNLDVIKCADYIIDIGPEGGDRGGTVIAEGTPEQVAKVKESYTGHYIRQYLKK